MTRIVAARHVAEDARAAQEEHLDRVLGVGAVERAAPRSTPSCGCILVTCLHLCDGHCMLSLDPLDQRVVDVRPALLPGAELKRALWLIPHRSDDGDSCLTRGPC